MPPGWRVVHGVRIPFGQGRLTYSSARFRTCPAIVWLPTNAPDRFTPVTTLTTLLSLRRTKHEREGTIPERLGGRQGGERAGVHNGTSVARPARAGWLALKPIWNHVQEPPGASLREARLGKRAISLCDM